MRHVVTTAAITLVLNQHAEVIQDTQVLLDDIFLCSAGVIRCQDVKLFWRLSYLEHEFKQPHRGLSGRRGPLQKLHWGVATQECLVLI